MQETAYDQETTLLKFILNKREENARNILFGIHLIHV